MYSKLLINSNGSYSGRVLITSLWQQLFIPLQYCCPKHPQLKLKGKVQLTQSGSHTVTLHIRVHVQYPSATRYNAFRVSNAFIANAKRVCWRCQTRLQQTPNAFAEMRLQFRLVGVARSARPPRVHATPHQSFDSATCKKAVVTEVLFSVTVCCGYSFS